MSSRTWLRPRPAGAAALLVAAVLLLSLILSGGCSKEAGPPTTAAGPAGATTGTSTGGTGTTSTTVGMDAGRTLYERLCAGCHGTDGKAKFAPTVVGVDAGALEAAVRKGRGSMPGFGGQLGDQEIAAIAKYVGTLR